MSEEKKPKDEKSKLDWIVEMGPYVTREEFKVIEEDWDRGYRVKCDSML